MFPRVGFRPPEELRREAELFLQQYHPSLEIPVPIEAIVEFGLELEIRPFWGLRDYYGVDGFLTSDLLTVIVDDTELDRNTNRYRFTLAHEVGHLILHRSQVQSLHCETPAEWRPAMRAIPPKDYSAMEFQAYEFAGCVLVPRQQLLDLYQEAGSRAEERGIDLDALGDLSLSYVAGWIADEFRVSTAVIERRLKREGVVG